MYTLYKFHFLNGISEINQLFDDILIIWPAPVFYDNGQLTVHYPLTKQSDVSRPCSLLIMEYDEFELLSSSFRNCVHVQIRNCFYPNIING